MVIKAIRFKSLLLLGSLIMFVQCGPATRISHSWKNTTASKSYHHILVVAMINQQNHALRSDMENHLVNDLLSRGLQAHAAIGWRRVGAPLGVPPLDQRAAVGRSL